VSDDAKAVFNTILSDPSLVKGITDLEIKYIQQNGIYPASLIYKIGQNTGTKIDGMYKEQTGPNQETVYWYNKNGEHGVLGVYPNYPVGGGSTGGGLTTAQTISLNADIQAAITYISQVQQRTDLNEAQKQAMINTAVSRVEGPYANNNDILSYVRGRIGTYSTVGSQLGNVTGSLTQEDYQKDLSSELAMVDSIPGYANWFGGIAPGDSTTDAAKAAKARLIAKYPTYTTSINAAFKQYGV
jgi:hypothetical protein